MQTPLRLATNAIDLDSFQRQFSKLESKCKMFEEQKSEYYILLKRIKDVSIKPKNLAQPRICCKNLPAKARSRVAVKQCVMFSLFLVDIELAERSETCEAPRDRSRLSKILWINITIGSMPI